MSDDEHGHDEHGHEAGGHEIDQMPNSRLFRLLFGLTVLTALCCWGVVELFNMQVRGIERERNATESYRLTAYKEEQRANRDNWARVEILDDDGLTVRDPKSNKPPEAGVAYGKGPHKSIVNRMPLAEAKTMVLKDPRSFTAQWPYPGWKNPDPEAKDAAPAGAGKPANPRPLPGARPPPLVRPQPGARPTGARPTPGAKPAGAKPAGAKPPGAKPPGVKPPGAKPPGAKPQ